ncbi:MAG: riboflavin synthase [Bacteroidota bacterium]|nr:riboflavin synthase [Bacteroidota bacterium]
MFTGIIEEIGNLKSIRHGHNAAMLEIKAAKVLTGTRIGDSISVNGVCLTVTSLGPASFIADAMPETLHRSNLGALHAGNPLNLERALRLGDRFGGHIVSGHIDGTGTILNFKEDENAIWITIEAQPSILRYIVEKGSIAIDGISLTVANVEDNIFKVSIIPHTRNETTLCGKASGSKVNLECDIVAKYIERFSGFDKQSSAESASAKLSMSFLKENGFF